MASEIAQPTGAIGQWLARIDNPLLGTPPRARLPDRVARAIDEQQQRSEVIICWAQLSAIVLFTVFYTIAVGATSNSARFSPVPWMLASYAALTFVRLKLAQKGFLTGRLIRLYDIADICVMVALIWFYHVEYHQLAARTSRDPTILYVFLIIAIRSLRFDPQWVLLTGILAAAGWLLLCVFVFRHTGMTGEFTNDFLGNAARLLAGIEIDTILSILAFTVILALAIERARRLLVLHIAEAAATAELSRFFAPDIAESIIQADEKIELGKGVLRDAAVMFLDLRGFTTLSSTLPPNLLVEMVISYQSCVVPIIRKHGGSVITYLGDGIMIVFGATRPSTTYAADCLRATEELLMALPAWTEGRKSQGLPASAAGIGVASGRVTYGAIGTEGRLEYAVIGDPVSRSAKLQSMTKAQQSPALAAADTWQAAIVQGYVPSRRHDRRSGMLPGVADQVEFVAMF